MLELGRKLVVENEHIEVNYEPASRPAIVNEARAESDLLAAVEAVSAEKCLVSST